MALSRFFQAKTVDYREGGSFQLLCISLNNRQVKSEKRENALVFSGVKGAKLYMRKDLSSKTCHLADSEQVETLSLKSLFLRWVEYDRMLEDDQSTSAGARTDQEMLERLADNVLAAQSEIMEISLSIPAVSHQDLLYKLAFWRWDISNQRGEMDTLQRSDQLVYSVFKDLLALTGVKEVAKDIDFAADAETAPLRSVKA